MSSQFEPQPPASEPASTCSLCGSVVMPDIDRCSICGLYQTGGGRSNPFTGVALWILIGGLAVVYAVTVLVVAVAR
jgi:hypothetical protein